MPYEVLIGPEGFVRSRPSWEELESAGAAHVFQTYAFADSWLRTAGAATRSTPLVVRYEVHGRTVGLFPACVTHFGAIRLTTWLGGPHVLDYGDVLFDQAAADIPAEEFIRGSLRALRTHIRLAPLYLTNVRRDATAFEALSSLARPHKASVAPFLGTTGEFDTYIASRSRDVRKKIRHGTKELERSGQLGFSVLRRDDREYEGAVRRLLDLKIARYRQIDDSSGVFKPGWVEFRERHALSDESVAVALLTVGGRFAAAQIMAAYRRRLYLLVSAFDAEFAHASPGFVLDHHTIKYAFENEFDICDFCWGGESHKFQWTCDSEPLTTFVSNDAVGRAVSSAAALRHRVVGGATPASIPDTCEEGS